MAMFFFYTLQIPEPRSTVLKSQAKLFCLFLQANVSVLLAEVKQKSCHLKRESKNALRAHKYKHVAEIGAICSDTA